MIPKYTNLTKCYVYNCIQLCISLNFMESRCTNKHEREIIIRIANIPAFHHKAFSSWKFVGIPNDPLGLRKWTIIWQQVYFKQVYKLLNINSLADKYK